MSGRAAVWPWLGALRWESTPSFHRCRVEQPRHALPHHRDEYFARPEPLAATGGEPFDLSFIDGLHLFEFAYRDFINAERHSSARGVIIFDDVLPRSVDDAARERHTATWTGDVYPMLAVLARYRPDLIVLPVSTQPTGLLLVLGLDPTSTILGDHYDEIMAEYRSADRSRCPRFCSTGS